MSGIDCENVHDDQDTHSCDMTYMCTETKVLEIN